MYERRCSAVYELSCPFIGQRYKQNPRTGIEKPDNWLLVPVPVPVPVKVRVRQLSRTQGGNPVSERAPLH